MGADRVPSLASPVGVFFISSHNCSFCNESKIVGDNQRHHPNSPSVYDLIIESSTAMDLRVRSDADIVCPETAVNSQ